MATPTILKEIVERKWQEVFDRRQRVSEETLASMAASMPTCRGFAGAIEDSIAAGRAAVIAELKRASPSKGVIREDFDAPEIALDYAASGATCLSVLTDRDFFQGAEEYLIAASQACSLPILRKDFIIDPYQVIESRTIGADCILLIVAILADSQLRDLYEIALGFGLDVLVEVHDRPELDRAMDLAPRLIGINNRDLNTFETTLATTLTLAEDLPGGTTVVTESGIQGRADVEMMQAQGINAFLVGEALMKEDAPGSKLQAMFF